MSAEKNVNVLSPDMQVLVKELSNVRGELKRIGDLIELALLVIKPASQQPAKPATQPERIPYASAEAATGQPAKPTGIPSRDDPIGLREYFRAVGKEFNGFIDRVEASENLGEKTIEVTSPYFKDKNDFGRFAGHMKETFDAEYVADRDHKRYYWVIKKP
jgi:hypothetical protein